MGPAATALEHQGLRTKIGDKNRAIRERNRQRAQQQEPVPEAQRPSFKEWLEQYEREKSPEIERDR
jgi:hypothetical protein